MIKDKITVAWECAYCGHRHLWTWPKSDEIPGPTWAECEKGCPDTYGELVRIGRDAMALANPDQRYRQDRT